MLHAQTLNYIYFQVATVTILLTAQTLNTMKSFFVKFFSNFQSSLMVLVVIQLLGLAVIQLQTKKRIQKLKIDSFKTKQRFSCINPTSSPEQKFSLCEADSNDNQVLISKPNQLRDTVKSSLNT